MFNESDIKDLPVVELEVPDGKNAKTFLEEYLGTVASSAAEMPADVDVEATVFIKLK